MSYPIDRQFEWLRRARLAIVEAPFYILDLEKQHFDAEAIVERAARCKVNVIRLGAARTYAYFQSKIAPIAPSIGERDFVEEVIRAAKPKGIKVVTYIQLGYENVILYQQHPNWVSRLLDGSPMAVGRPEEVHMCCNSPYREWKISVIRELCGNYDVDGVYLDGPTYFGYCYCPYCRRKFAEAADIDIPEVEDWSDPSWQTYALWRYQVLASFLSDIREAVRQVRPDIPLINNNITYFHGRCRRESRIPELLSEISDGMLLESHRTHQKLPWHRVGQHAKYGSASGKPLWMWWEYNVGDWSFSSCSPAELRLKYAEVLANGGTPGIFPFDVTERAPEGLETLRDCFSLQEENEERIFSARPMRFVALPYSRQTAEWYGGADPEKEYTESHTGMYRALIHAHVPFSVLRDPDLTEEKLSGYQVLLLSNLACLSDSQLEAIRRFVSNGGGLVATFQTSLFDDRGRRRPNFGLADVFGVDFEGTPSLEVRGQLAPGYDVLEKRQEWVMWLEQPVKGGKAAGVGYIDVPPSTGIPFNTQHQGILAPVGRHTYVSVRDGSEGAGRLLQPSLRSHPLGSATPYPGAVTHTYAKGRVVYFAADIGNDYAQMRVPYLSAALQQALAWTANQPWPVVANIPSSVELQLHQGEDRQLLYLINFTGDSIDPRDEVTSVAPLEGVALQVKVNRLVQQVLWLNRRQPLDWSIQDNYCHFVLPCLDEFAIVSIEYGEAG